MMEEFVLADKQLKYLLQFYKDPFYTTGPIFGQCDGEKKYMVHVAQAADRMAAVLPPTETIEHVDINILAEHAKQAIRVLPGGMSVLGIFVVGPKLISEGTAWDTHLIQSLKVLVEMCSCDLYQKGIPSNRKFVLLSVKGLEEGVLECSSCEFLGKDFVVKQIKCKIVPEIAWHEIAAMVNLDVHMLISKKITALPLWEQLKPMLLKLEELVNSAGLTFPKAGIVKDTDSISEVLKTQQKNLVSVCGHNAPAEKDKQTLTVDVVLKEDFNDSKEVNIVIGDGSKMILSGIVVCRTYVHADADVQMCKKVVTEDIIHSLIARLEMHCDSLIEEEPDDVCDDVVIHEPPRRMMVRLPCSEVLFSDYLFPGELVSEAKQSLQSLLDVSVRDVDVLHMSAGLSEFDFEELNTRAVQNTSLLPAKKDILKFTLLVFAFIAPVIAFLVFHHQK